MAVFLLCRKGLHLLTSQICWDMSGAKAEWSNRPHPYTQWMPHEFNMPISLKLIALASISPFWFPSGKAMYNCDYGTISKHQNRGSFKLV